MMDYEKLLKKAKENLPKTLIQRERFEIPKVKGHVEGVKTIITNFVQICSILHRDVNQLLKYLQRELATPAIIDGPRLVLGRKISSSLINDKIEKYAKEFVLCGECGKPDTKLIKEGRILEKKCMACGAKHPVRSKI
jgi:translation initiation factor 2 subunit 2